MAHTPSLVPLPHFLWTALHRSKRGRELVTQLLAARTDVTRWRPGSWQAGSWEAALMPHSTNAHGSLRVWDCPWSCPLPHKLPAFSENKGQPWALPASSSANSWEHSNCKPWTIAQVKVHKVSLPRIQTDGYCDWCPLLALPSWPWHSTLRGMMLRDTQTHLSRWSPLRCVFNIQSPNIEVPPQKMLASPKFHPKDYLLLKSK